MKNIAYIITFLLIISCDNENAPDCFKSTGDSIEKEFIVDAFTKIEANKNVELIITYSDTYSIITHTGENLIDNVTATVQNGTLILKDENSCNLTRDYGITKFYVSAPNLTEIRNSSQFEVSSNGVLPYDTLKLVSEDYTSSDDYNVGTFNLQVNANTITVIINNLTTTTISGTTNSLSISYASGDARFEGRYLIAENVSISHRGTNDIIVNPQVSLSANLISTGNVIVVNTPTTVTVQEQFTGRVIYE